MLLALFGAPKQHLGPFQGHQSLPKVITRKAIKSSLDKREKWLRTSVYINQPKYERLELDKRIYGVKTDEKQERKGKVGDLPVLSLNQSENWCSTRRCIKLKIA